MPNYYVNDTAQSESGDHEVHEDGCYWLSLARNTTFLGWFASCHGAVAKAKQKYPATADGCKHCSPACHRS